MLMHGLTNPTFKKLYALVRYKSTELRPTCKWVWEVKLKIHALLASKLEEGM